MRFVFVSLTLEKLVILCIILKVYLDESAQEVDSLNSRIQELEAQLGKENEECKRYEIFSTCTC